MKYPSIREEELKNKVAADYFWIYDTSRIIGNIDFCVQMQQEAPTLFERESLLWAEAKQGQSDVYVSLAQLVLTIGKARTFDRYLPPPFLGAFDGEKIAFVPYADISDIFYINDFNWNVTPSNHATREFGLVRDRVKTIFDSEALIYRFGADDRELTRFIKENFLESKRGLLKTRIDKSNFMVIYNKWLADVKPSIGVDWEKAKKAGIIDGDFYLADLLSQDNETLREKLFVLLKHDHYELDRITEDSGLFRSSRTDFKDKQKAHKPVLEPLPPPTARGLLGLHHKQARPTRAARRTRTQRILLHAPAMGGPLPAIPGRRAGDRLARRVLRLGLCRWHGQPAGWPDQ